MHQTSPLCLLAGLLVLSSNGVTTSAFCAPREVGSVSSSRRQSSRRYMSDPAGAGGQQQQQQQIYDQNGNPVPTWNTAVDPASGNTYWYNALTGETSWNPPGVPAPPPPPSQPQQQQQIQQQPQQYQQQQPQQMQQQPPQTRQLMGGAGTRRNPDADRVVNKADVYLAMLKKDSTTRTMARHYGDIDASNEVFGDPEIEDIKNMVVENPFVEKGKELLETSPEEMLPIIMLQNAAEEEEKQKQITEQVKRGPNYKERMAQMKKKKGGGGK